MIGSYRGPHIEVVDCTEPGAADKATLSSFTRRDERHQEAATEAWRKSHRRQTYVGEWHSHPFGRPIPSGTDRRAWQSVVAKLSVPCLFVLVSPAGWHVYRIRPGTTARDMVQLNESENGNTGVIFR